MYNSVESSVEEMIVFLVFLIFSMTKLFRRKFMDSQIRSKFYAEASCAWIRKVDCETNEILLRFLQSAFLPAFTVVIANWVNYRVHDSTRASHPSLLLSIIQIVNFDRVAKCFHCSTLESLLSIFLLAGSFFFGQRPKRRGGDQNVGMALVKCRYFRKLRTNYNSFTRSADQIFPILGICQLWGVLFRFRSRLEIPKSAEKETFCRESNNLQRNPSQRKITG